MQDAEEAHALLCEIDAVNAAAEGSSGAGGKVAEKEVSSRASEELPGTPPLRISNRPVTAPMIRVPSIHCQRLTQALRLRATHFHLRIHRLVGNN